MEPFQGVFIPLLSFHCRFAAVRLFDVLMIFQLNTQTQSTYRDVDLWLRERPPPPQKKKVKIRFSFSPFHPLGGIIVKGREIVRVKKIKSGRVIFVAFWCVHQLSTKMKKEKRKFPVE